MERIGSIFAVCLSAADQRQVPSLRATVFMPSNHLSPNGKIAKVPEEVLLKYRDDLHQTYSAGAESTPFEGFWKNRRVADVVCLGQPVGELRHAQAQLADRAGQLEHAVTERTAKLQEIVGDSIGKADLV